ncbi:MAG: hypothetical protein ACKVT2_08090 [Saprospiraceae bacterium]
MSSTSSLAGIHPTEVGALSCNAIAQTFLAQSVVSGICPARYRPAFAFSVILYPQGRCRGLLPFYSLRGYLATALR